MLKQKKRINLSVRHNLLLVRFIKIFAIIFCITMMGCSQTDKPAGMSDKKERTEKNISDAKETNTLQYPAFATTSATEQIDFIINSEERYCIFNGEHYGFMTEGGKELTPYVYDAAYPFHEGLACVSYKQKYGFIDLNGEETIPFIYDDAAPFMEGLAYFVLDNRYGFMDRKGNPVFYLECDSVSSFQDGMAYFSIDGKYGYIDKSGNIVIKPVYDDAEYFQNGIAIVVKKGKYGVINKEGKEIIAPLYDYIDMNYNFIIAKTNNQYCCFDNTGKKYLAESYDEILVDKEGRFCIKKNGQYGFANSDGIIAASPQYEKVSLIPGKDLAIVKSNGLYGVIDFQGKIKVPLIYQTITPYNNEAQEEGILVVALDNKEGCLNLTDFSECIPIIYDKIYNYTKSKLVVKKGEKYGIINQNGNLDIPIEFDEVQLFEDGSAALKRNQVILLFNSNNELINIDSDSITKTGECYQIKKDNKYNFIDKKGEKILPQDWSYTSHECCYGTFDIFVLRFNDCYGILKTKDTGETDITRTLLKNMITPRIRLFHEFTQNPPVNEEAKLSWGDDTIRNKGYIKDFKLYNLDGSGKPVLYYSALPYVLSSFSLTNNGFCAIKDNQLHYLVTGYGSGGSVGRSNVDLWYDKKTQQVMMGKTIDTGGFCGFGTGVTIYSYKNEEALEVISFYCTTQSTRNYEEKVLLENASLFYNDNGEPCTSDTILQEQTVTEYSVNETRVSKEKYMKLFKQYYCIEMLFPMIKN